ncbi:hypothetical protein R3W88_012301 [Solanum pinnatisectum]|uniref:Uncharacterized protein n=1 Tax=Solanum pinnatisectum TaxID=50273 RepID=A0AAV9L9X4_9SOLN|nr:hypothetical protein R3W88_012301 [Solanum pinnatisectum]
MSTAGLKEMLGERQRTRMVQFLMKLRPEFESIRGSLLNREVTPALDVVLVAVLPNCPKKKTFYAYCKITGHHISDCRRPNSSRPAHQAYQTDITKSAGFFPSGHDLERLIQDSIAAALPGAISSALSASSGQLVDQNCVVKFSPNDCVVQNLKTEMTMAKGR